jgi:2-amino-4-hydroxy-6-hydroxymethyldihydropteridine diphosphokinase
MIITYLIFGSNLGNRLELLEKAKQQVEKSIGNVLQSSSIYDTEPWGFVHKNWFLNIVMAINTNLEPFALLVEIKKIEASLGRIMEDVRYTARLIDIDILFYDDLVLHTPELIIPHPEIPRRKFVLEPLTEIAPDLVHPVLKKTMMQLLKECEDTSVALKYEG